MSEKKEKLGHTIPKPKWYLRVLIVIVSFFMTITKRAKIHRINTGGLKWPYIIVASHASFIDFAWNARLTNPHHGNYICSIEEFVGRHWLMSGVGCFQKRKYTKDSQVVKNILKCIRNGNSVSIYAEARYSICGVNERIDSSIGKLVKMADVPLVVLITHGDFLASPHYNQKPGRRTKYEIIFKCIATKEEVEALTAEELQARLEKEFVFDDYKWQYDNRVKVKSRYRAHNLHRILYKCPDCGLDYSMRSKYTKLWCENCRASYEMDIYGRLYRTDGGEAKFVHVPDWYRWERSMVNKEVEDGTYRFTDTVRLEHLDDFRHGFRQLGFVTFTQDMDGIHLAGKLDDGSDFKFDNPAINTPSIHVEYNFKKKGTVKQGQALDINTVNDTWFIYPQTENAVLTKIHLATEALYDRAAAQRDEKEN